MTMNWPEKIVIYFFFKTAAFSIVKFRKKGLLVLPLHQSEETQVSVIFQCKTNSQLFLELCQLKEQ